MKKKKPMTVSEMARLGAIARNQSLTVEERKEAARKAVNARWARAKYQKKDSPQK